MGQITSGGFIVGYMYNAIKWVRVLDNLNGELSLNFGSTILQNLMKLKLSYLFEIERELLNNIYSKFLKYL